MIKKPIHKHIITDRILRVVNIVATFNLGCLLDVDQLATSCEFIIAHPNTFASGVGRFAEPNCVFSIFSTGNVTIAGIKSHTEAYYACVKLQHIIKTIGKLPYAGIHNFRIINSTLSTNIGNEINIYKMKEENPFITLDHKTFPNVTLRSRSTVSITVPISGKVNVLGSTTLKIAREAFLNALPNLQRYNVVNFPLPPEVLQKKKKKLTNEPRKRRRRGGVNKA